jgi:hypothetical protein
VVGWLWIFTISLVTGELTVSSVVDIIDIVSINVSFDLI